jgi:hypothetical protein
VRPGWPTPVQEAGERTYDGREWFLIASALAAPHQQGNFGPCRLSGGLCQQARFADTRFAGEEQEWWTAVGQVPM